METIRVYVGTEPMQYIPQQVLGDSIRRTTRQPVEVHYCFQNKKRVGGTNFGFVRFMVPFFANYTGKAIYLDADMVVLHDIKDLYDSLPDDAWVNFVRDAEGFFGEKPAVRDNYTSVMVLRCDQLKDWDPETMFDHVVPNKATLKEGEMHYRDFMKLTWFDQSKIAELDPRWNHLNIVRDDTKLIHFTHVASQPWRNPKHRLAEVWEKHLRLAVQSGAVTKKDIIRAILRRHLHPYFFRAGGEKAA